jgi:hypothetical protein
MGRGEAGELGKHIEAALALLRGSPH